MNTLNFLDSNVWLALIWSRHAHSEKAHSWFAGAAEQQFFFCRFTQLTVLRLLTTESVIGKRNEDHARSLGLMGSRVGRPAHRISAANPTIIEKEFRSRSKISSRSPKLWADAYLLAFAAASGLKFVTFDRALHARGGEGALSYSSGACIPD